MTIPAAIHSAYGTLNEPSSITGGSVPQSENQCTNRGNNHERGPAETTEDNTMSWLCTWCGTAYEPRSNGGKPQRFCSAPCRRAFETACRIWAAAEYEAERVSIFTLRTALYQRARSLQHDPAPERGKAPETEKRTDGALAGAAPMADVR